MTLIGNLLALPTAATAVIVVVSVLVALTALYGAFRKFSRMSWAGWQLPILFALFLLFDLIPMPQGAYGYALVIGVGFVMIALVLGIGAIIRGLMRRRTTPAPTALRVFDRILGILTGVLDWAVIVLVVGGAVLSSYPQMPVGGETLSFLEPVYSSVIWQRLGAHAADLLLITVLTFSVKAGYKLGIGRFLWAGVTLLLSFVAVFGAIYLVLKVPFLIAFANTLAGIFPINEIAAWVIGRGLAALIVFLVFFVVIILISLLINFIFNKVNKVRALNIISGLIMALLFYVVCVAFLTGVYFGIAYLAQYTAGTENEHLAAVGQYLALVDELLGSTGLISFLYTNNPLRLLL